MRNVWKVIGECWPRISRRGRFVLKIYSLSLVLISILDGLSLMLFSELIKSSGDVTLSIASSHSVQTAIMCILLFLTRSLLATLITWFGFMYFAKEEVNIGQENFEDYLKMPWEIRSKEKISDFYSFVERGPAAISQQLMVSSATLVAEIFGTILIISFVIALDWQAALTILAFFLFIALLQHKLMSKIAQRTGNEIASFHNKTYDLLSDVFSLEKVLRVLNDSSVEKTLHKIRTRLAFARARSGFLDAFPRFLLEAELVIGLLAIGSFVYLTRGVNEIFPFLSIFAIAGFRILPSINRIQSLLTSLIGREPLAKLGLRTFQLENRGPNNLSYFEDDGNLLLKLSNVSYTYPSCESECLSDISLEFERGRQYAIVGPSGSGKTTLIDLCMGLLTPSKGKVEWSFKTFENFGYVPQDNYLASTSINLNVALEWDMLYVDESKVQNALMKSSLETLRQRIHSDQNSDRVVLSGGQAQRVGIARVEYRNASIIFLDEPTSALDAETEFEIMKVVNGMRANKTVFIVAHRLSTIKNADRIVYLENGRVLGFDSFTQLQKRLPQFARQIELGLIN